VKSYPPVNATVSFGNVIKANCSLPATPSMLASLNSIVAPSGRTLPFRR